MKVKSLFFLILIVMVLLTAFACQKEVADPDPVPAPAQWQQIADFGGIAVSGAVGFTIGNRAYVGTGEQSSTEVNGVIESKGVSDFWEYNPDANSWSRVADYGGGRITDGIGFSIGNLGYAGLGHGPLFEARRDFWAYDPAANQWTKKADFPGPARHRGVGIAVGGKGYFVGGVSIDNGVYTARLDTWEYDPQADSWTRKADFPGESRWGATGFAIGSKLVIGFGEGEQAVTRSFWEYDTQADTWTRKNDFPGRPRVGMIAATLGGMAYLGTGNATDNNEDLKDLWKYEPAADRWTASTALPAQADGRWGAVAFTLGQNLYIGEGRAGFVAISTIPASFWRLSIP